MKYICSVCGYVYDEAIGDPERGIAPGTKWADVPEDWDCPLCGAIKFDFVEERDPIMPVTIEENHSENENDSLRQLSFGEMSALFSNLSKGCMKQYRSEEADLFNQLAEFYQSKGSIAKDSDIKALIELINSDLASGYAHANNIANEASDRGALRSLVWGEKVSKIVNSILSRYEKQKESLLENTHIYVCDICGFVYIGDNLPDICPICKVPNEKIIEVKRG